MRISMIGVLGEPGKVNTFETESWFDLSLASVFMIRRRSLTKSWPFLFTINYHRNLGFVNRGNNL